MIAVAKSQSRETAGAKYCGLKRESFLPIDTIWMDKHPWLTHEPVLEWTTTLYGWVDKHLLRLCLSFRQFPYQDGEMAHRMAHLLPSIKERESQDAPGSPMNYSVGHELFSAALVPFLTAIVPITKPQT